MEMALSNISGFPRIGRNRELKFATEGYWRGQTSADELAATAKAIRVENWKLMQDQGIDLIPSNDFSYYDQVLDTITLVGAVPERYGWTRFSPGFGFLPDRVRLDLAGWAAEDIFAHS